jgi:hypothetical protein
MMPFLLIMAATCLLATGAAAQMNWFSPSPFTVTCQLHQQCMVNAACTRIAKTLTVEHNPDVGLTKFVLPDGTPSEGVLGVMSIGTTQTLAATTSTDAQKMYRINIFPDAAVTIGVVHFLDRPEDTFLYGSCRSPES